MNILFIAAAPITTTSSANIQNISYIKGFHALGHKVTILCADSEDLYKEEIIYKLGLQGIDIIGIPYTKPVIIKQNQRKEKLNVKDILRNVYHNFFIFDHYKILVNKLNQLKLENYYDIMITASDPRSSHLIGQWFKENGKELYGQWVQLYGDPILLDINNKYLLPKWFIRAKEKNLIKKADKVFYVSVLTLNEQKKLYKNYKEKMYMIPLPYPEEKIYNNEPLTDKIRLGYFGDYNFSLRDIKPLYNAVNKSSHIELLIVGNSDKKLPFTKNIEIKERVHFSEISELEKDIDILVGLSNLRGTQIPGKLFYYSGTNKPVLFIIDGKKNYKNLLRDYINGFNRFIICDNNEEEIYRTLYNIKYLSKNVNSSPLEEFSYKNVAEDFIALINK